ncbi:hypothetical protein [Chromobacterium sp. Panama]|uniref:hypothetical protein n=1 Tax=Chromobacterium sp. Panama TaxID=2161826 RepID=UPI0011B2010C|nr:hypothetical protein [Chromobacterium sp. Panama]
MENAHHAQEMIVHYAAPYPLSNDAVLGNGCIEMPVASEGTQVASNSLIISLFRGVVNYIMEEYQLLNSKDKASFVIMALSVANSVVINVLGKTSSWWSLIATNVLILVSRFYDCFSEKWRGMTRTAKFVFIFGLIVLVVASIVQDLMGSDEGGEFDKWYLSLTSTAIVFGFYLMLRAQIIAAADPIEF